MPQSKFLVEFLQEKQEPFSLEDHLVERGYRIPSRISKISAIFGLKKRRHGIRHCSDVFKLVFSQVDSNKSIKNQENAEPQRLSSATCTTTTMSISCSESTTEHSCCSESDPEDTHSSDACSFTREGDAEGMLKLRTMEDNKQLSPVSVLEQTESVYGSPIHYKQCNSNQGVESPNKDEEELQQQFHISDSYSQYIINMKLLRRPGKLLIDCTREVIENHKKKDKRREHLNQILGTDQLWKSVCENVCLWSQEPIDETNTSHLVHSDISSTSELWNDRHKEEKMELAIEIGDAILDQIIHEIAENQLQM